MRIIRSGLHNMHMIRKGQIRVRLRVAIVAGTFSSTSRYARRTSFGSNNKAAIKFHQLWHLRIR